MKYDLKIIPLIFRTSEYSEVPIKHDRAEYLWGLVLKNVDSFFENILAKLLIVEFHQLKMEGLTDKKIKEYLLSDDYRRNRLESFYKTQWDAVQLYLKNTKCQFAKVLQSLEADRQDLGRTFGINVDEPITSIDWGKSDPHNACAQVHIIHFKRQKIVYKPRQGKTLAAFNEFISCVNSRIQNAHFVQRLVDRSDYHWVEYVSHIKCESEIELESYYYRLGSLMAVSYALCATDFHYENLIGVVPDLVEN